MDSNGPAWISMAVAALFAVAPAVAQVRETAKLNGPFKEEVKSEAPVSGRALHGISARPIAWTPLPDLAVETAPSSSERSVCVTIASRDGRYFARNAYVIAPSPAAGIVALPIRTQHPEIFASSVADGLAVLVEEGACDKRQSVFRIARSVGRGSESATAQRNVAAYVNSGRADATLLVAAPGEAASRFVCAAITDGKRTTYDSVCNVALPTARSARLLQLHLELCSFGECRRAKLGDLLDE